jgi:hypothetical protein
MTKGNDTFERLGTYVEELTDLTAGTVKEVASQWAGLLNTIGDKGSAESAFQAFRESVRLGIKGSAKAWVATRQLMIDLAD